MYKLLLCVLCPARFALLTASLAGVILYTGCASLPDGQAGEPPKKNGDEKEFSEVIKDFNPITGGLFTIYSNPKDGRALLEIKPDQFDKIFLCSVTRESGEGTYFDAAALQDNFPLFFRQVNKRIQLIHKNVLFRADRTKPIFRALEKGISDSMISSSVALSKPHTTTGAVLVSLNDLFLFDRYNLAHHLSEATKADFGFDRDNSFFSTLKTFPENTDIEITMHFRCTKPVGSPTLADARSMFLKYYYSICTLPAAGYVPRLADDRVGHFLTMYADYSSAKPETPYIRYVNRWRLEKQDPNAPLSPPKKPITFWLDKNIPLEYRDSVKNGVLLWNKAFEKIGFKDAVVVLQQPDDADWDPADVRYNVIRWIVSPGFIYAVGPSHDDPFTGELYTADIRVSADMVRSVFNAFEEVVNPIQMNSRSVSGDPDAYRDELPTPNSKPACTCAQGKTANAAFAMSVLQGRAFLDGDEAEADKFVQTYLVDLVAHEVGHTLGLRHNFKSSSIRSFSQLHNKEVTAREGICGSVMDYNPCNISLDPKQQGEFWMSTIGLYDEWAIEYAYKSLGAKTPDEELSALKTIASRCAQPELAYGTDEDAFGNAPVGMDPLCNMWDLSSDPLAYLNRQLALGQELWSRIETKFSKPGEGYQKMRRIFRQGASTYGTTAGLASRFIGGVYHRRDHVADPNSRLPLEPVSAQKQRQALELIVNRVFALTESDLPPADILNKLAPERMPRFTGDATPTADIQVHSMIAGIQQSPLNYLYDVNVLQRLNEMNLRYKPGEERFGLAEMFRMVREGIWGELKTAKPIDSLRRRLQRAHMEKIIVIYLADTNSGIPSDAIALARADLVRLQSDITAILAQQGKSEISNLKSGMDTLTIAHLEDLKARIATTLDWKVTQPR